MSCRGGRRVFAYVDPALNMSLPFYLLLIARQLHEKIDFISNFFKRFKLFPAFLLTSIPLQRKTNYISGYMDHCITRQHVLPWKPLSNLIGAILITSPSEKFE